VNAYALIPDWRPVGRPTLSPALVAVGAFGRFPAVALSFGAPGLASRRTGRALCAARLLCLN